MKLQIPSGYEPLLNARQTEGAIKEIKDFFQMNLASELRLRRVTAPLFVKKGTGINDDLNGVERAVSFPVKDMDGEVCEIVHSLAKWKRLTLAEYGIEPGYGIYTDMNAIRADEELDNVHSLYVDQWDWERVMLSGERGPEFLKDIVRRIWSAIVRTEFMVCEKYPVILPACPRRFISSTRSICAGCIRNSPRRRGKMPSAGNTGPCSSRESAAPWEMGRSTTAVPPTTTTGAPPPYGMGRCFPA